MPRPTQAKCLHCSQLSVAQAQQLHGESGDDCWNPKRCHQRRSHYRHRIESNAKRRGKRSPSQLQEPMVLETEKIAVPVEFLSIGLLYLYREARKDAHLHAVAVTVWRGADKLAETELIHCMGMTNGQVKSYLQKVLVTLKEQYGITEFEPPIRLEPCECPIAPCPYKGEVRNFPTFAQTEMAIRELFEQALVEPEQANLNQLWQNVESIPRQMSKIDQLRLGGWAIAQLADLHHQRAMQWLSDWEEIDVEVEPLIAEDWLNELIQQTMHLTCLN